MAVQFDCQLAKHAHPEHRSRLRRITTVSGSLGVAPFVTARWPVAMNLVLREFLESARRSGRGPPPRFTLARFFHAVITALWRTQHGPLGRSSRTSERAKGCPHERPLGGHMSTTTIDPAKGVDCSLMADLVKAGFRQEIKARP